MSNGVAGASRADVALVLLIVLAKLIASFWFRAALSLTVLAGLLTRLNVREVACALVSIAPGYFFAAVLVGAAARAVMIGRWIVLLRAIGAPVSGWLTARIFLISSFIGTALPVGGADLTRAYALSRHVGGHEAAASVVVDRLLGVSALLTLGVVSVALGMPGADLALARLVAALCFTVAVVLLAALWADNLAMLVMPRILQRTRIGRSLLLAAGAMAPYRTRWGAVGVVFVLSLVVQWLRITEVFLLGAGLGIDVGFGYYLVFVPIGLVVFMLPISMAGIGLPQGIIVWLLRPAGVIDVQSFALSTLMVVLGALSALPGLCLYLLARRGRT